MLLGKRTQQVASRGEAAGGEVKSSLTAQLHQERMQRLQEQARKEPQAAGGDVGRGEGKSNTKKKGKGGGAGAGGGGAKGGVSKKDKLEDVDADDVDAVMKALDLDRGEQSDEEREGAGRR